jgi:Rnl2 family RNA ligase
MIQFKKYGSIEHTSDNNFLEQIRLEDLDKQEFVVQEKVHGSNTCFITDGDEISFGKRNGFIDPDEYFYDHEELIERYKSKVIALFSVLKEKFPNIKMLTIFGEMFGGNYPHPDVENDRRITNIQKGVFYSPIHEFYAFDIYITGEERGRYLPVDETNALFEQCGFFYAKTLFRGSLEQCMQYPNDSTSIISNWLGYPPIEDNTCEGVVIRPAVPIYLSDGTRVLLKNKNARFSEKISKKKRDPMLFIAPSYSETLTNLLPIAEDYVTENRLNNVISKIGQVSIPKEISKLIALFSQDILEDFLKEHSGEYAAIEKNEQRIFNKHVSGMAIKMIKEVYAF